MTLWPCFKKNSANWPSVMALPRVACQGLRLKNGLRYFTTGTAPKETYPPRSFRSPRSFLARRPSTKWKPVCAFALSLSRGAIELPLHFGAEIAQYARAGGATATYNWGPCRQLPQPALPEGIPNRSRRSGHSARSPSTACEYQSPAQAKISARLRAAEGSENKQAM